MPTDPPEMSDAEKLKMNLLAMYSHRGDGLPTQYVNPDGPDAVAALAELEAENARLREGLRPFAKIPIMYQRHRWKPSIPMLDTPAPMNAYTVDDVQRVIALLASPARS